MDSVSRLIAAVFLAFALWPSSAFAIGVVSGVTTPHTKWFYQGLPCTSPDYETQADAGAGAAVCKNAQPHDSAYSYVYETGCGVGLVAVFYGGNVVQCQQLNLFTRTVNTIDCPANSLESAGGCLCNLAFKPGSGAASCVAYTCERRNLGDSAMGPYLTSPSTDTTAVCPTNPASPAYGCQVESQTQMTSQDQAGQWWRHVTESVSANACQGTGTGSPTAPTPEGVPPAPDIAASGTAPQTPCAAGTCAGVVNGASVCVPNCNVNRTIDGTTTVATPSGAGSAPAGTSTGTTTKETTCQAGICTTTSTTRDGNGNVTSISTGGQVSEANYCAQNPSSRTCGGSGSTGSGSGSGAGTGVDSSFGGACAATSCSGDAVVCAIAREQAKRACELQLMVGDGTTTPTMQLALDAVTAGDTPAGHPRNAANVSTSALTFDQTDLLAGGSCPADVSVPMPGGRSVVIAFSKVCTPASYLGNILLGLTALSCLGIVFLRGR